MRPLLIIDGDNLAHRAYHSTPKTIPSNAISGFFGMLVRIWREETPRGIFVAWDTLGEKTYRDELWPTYQGGRVFDEALIRQLDLLPKVCRAALMGVGKLAGYEADDLIASAVTEETARGGDCLILTSDRDAYQLASERVTILAPRRGTPVLDRIGPSEVVQRMGVLPEQVPDFKALAGDASDRIPGAKGIGPQSAARLLLRHGSLDHVVAEWPGPEAERVLMFREVVQMRSDAAVTLPDGNPDWDAAATSLREIGAERVADRIAALAADLKEGHP